jgi:hypothetical protein
MIFRWYGFVPTNQKMKTPFINQTNQPKDEECWDWKRMCFALIKNSL